MYMQKSSHAAFNGINAWVCRCSKQGGHIDAQERDRMDYIQTVKGPIDETGDLLQMSPRIKELHLSFQSIEREISFATYMLQGMTALRSFSKTRCFYVTGSGTSHVEPVSIPDEVRARDIERLLKDPIKEKELSHLSKDVEEMRSLLRSIRAKQQLDPATLPHWLTAMTA